MGLRKLSKALRRMVQALLVLLGLVALVTEAYAQQVDIKARAGALVSKGLQSQDAGRYDEAIAFYKAAYDLLPHPELLYNLGQAHRLKGERGIALDYYRKYIALQPKGRASREARDWIAKIELAMRDEAAAEARNREVQRIAESERRAAELHRRDEDRLAQEQQSGDETRLEPTASIAPSPAEPPRRAQPSDSLSPRERAGIATGLGAVFVWAGAYGLVVNDHDNLAAGFLVAGGALAAASLYLLLTPTTSAVSPAKTAHRMLPVFGDHSAGLALTGRF